MIKIAEVLEEVVAVLGEIRDELHIMLNYGWKMPYSITQPVRASGWMSGWMKRDGVLSSFHFNVFRNSV